MRPTAALALLGTALLAGCGDSTSPGDARTVSLSFASGASTASTSITPGVNAAIVIGTGASAVTVNRVQLVLREIELKKASDDACDEGAGDDDACEEVSLGPVLVDLPLDGSVTSPISVAIPEGTYREIEFELHKPSDDDARDAAFVAANPTFARTSVRIEGVYNGAPFTLTSDANAEYEVEFSPALVVGAEGSNATINVDVARWFRTSAGGTIAPTSANLRTIEANIGEGFRAFSDDDRDGRRD